jgi:hypothetical protein
MSNPANSWKLDRFPKRASCRSGVVIPDEVQKAYVAWLETREINPRRGAQRLQADDTRYSAEIPGGSFAAEGAGWQLMCDYDVIDGNWATGEKGQVLFTDMGVVESDDLPDRG